MGHIPGDSLATCVLIDYSSFLFDVNTD